MELSTPTHQILGLMSFWALNLPLTKGIEAMMQLARARRFQFIYFLAIALLAFIAIVSIAYNVNTDFYTSDVTNLAKLHPFAGILSNLGINLWWISAASGFFATMVLRKINQAKASSFLLSSALLSTYLALDDQFLFHEHLVFEYFGKGEKTVYAILAISILIYFKSFWRLILETKSQILFLAIAFLALSVGLDLAWNLIWKHTSWRLGHWEFLIEEGAKWIGIVSWAIYHVNTAFHFVVNAYKPPTKIKVHTPVQFVRFTTAIHR